MSTLDVSCARCEKRFRVRAEFAGRSTRCPGCSAPITVGGMPAPAAPSKPANEEGARRRPRARDDDDEEPQRPAINWRPVESAFRREQVAVVFAMLGIVGSFFSFCLTSALRHSSDTEPIVILAVLLFGVGPALGTGAFGLMARISALGTPKESRARGSAMSSMLCSLSGLACLVILALAMLASIGSHEPDPLPMIVALGGLVLSSLGALATFFAFIAQIGIARRSASVSRAISRLGITVTICVLSLLGIGVLYTIVRELTDSPRYYGGGYDANEHTGFYEFVLGILIPLAFGVLLVLYHRLLAAGKEAATGETRARYDD